MKSNGYAAGRRFPSRLLGGVWLLTAVLLLWFGWHTSDRYIQYNDKKVRDISIEALRGEIIHIDEIVTMSARMAIATNDPQWQERFHNHRKNLVAVIKQAMAIAPEKYSSDAAKLADIANTELMRMEHQALELLSQDRKVDAEAIFLSPEYQLQKRLLHLGMLRFPVTRHADLRLIELQGKILYFDEVLTMSARMAAVTGDPVWQGRYQHFKPHLDESIMESIKLAPDGHSSAAAAQTGLANKKLVAMEMKAFDLIRQDRLVEAEAILFSPAYQAQKRMYVEGMEQFLERISGASQLITLAERNRASLHVFWALFAILLLLTGWFLVMRTLKLWRKDLLTTINNKKYADLALQSSEERFRALYDDNPSMYFTVDAQGTVLSVNNYGAEQLGYEKDELNGKSVLQVFYEEDKQSALNYLKKCLSEPHTLHRWELRKVRKDGSVLWVRETARAIVDDAGKITVLIVCEDITEAHSLSERLSYLASHDALTDLVNRRELEIRLQRALDTAKQQQVEHAFCYLDLDQFKIINDTYGHVAGDELLRQLSVVLHEKIRGRDTLARLGGDEFGILMEHCTLDQALRVADSLREAVGDFQFVWEGDNTSIAASMGLVPITQDSGTTTDVLKQADIACYVAKDAGRNRVHVYHENETAMARRH